MHIKTKTNSLFLFKRIAKLERTQSNAHQNKDKHRTPTTNVEHTKQHINNNRTTALEQTAAYATQGLVCNLLVPKH